jgi:hypothetical protein
MGFGTPIPIGNYTLPKWNENVMRSMGFNGGRVIAVVTMSKMAIATNTRKRTFYEMLSTFFLDASVLVFIFIPLDSVIQFGDRAISKQLVIGTSVGAVMFFAAAFIMKVIGDEL